MRNKTYYPQHPCGDGPALRPRTLTVGDLAAQLAELDPSLPVIFRSPDTGCFGSGVTYALDSIARETLERREIRNPARTFFDEEEGKDVEQEAYTDVLPAWDGVVLA